MNFWTKGFVANKRITDVAKNTSVWIIILSVNRLTIKAIIAPIENQKVKNPTVTISIAINSADITNQICHIIFLLSIK